MILKALGKFDYDADIPFDPDMGEFGFPEFSILYIKYYPKTKQMTDKIDKKRIIATIIFEDDSLDNFNVYQWLDK